MVQQTITICGKEVTLGYCFATEINYTNLTKGDSVPRYISEAAAKMDAISKGKGTEVPDVEKAIYLILAAELAYYGSKGEEIPLVDSDLMYADNPTDIYTALGTIILLYGQFYKLIPSEAEQAAKEQEGKEGKN